MTRTILITGASRGMGAACALLAAASGYRVGVNYRSDAAAAQTVLASIEAAGGSAFAVQADVAEGIRVNGVRPGLIDTGMHASGGEPGRIARLQSSVPLGRGGDAAEVARAVLWLLSDEASYTTGSFIDVSGGR